jgi:hypothetical protein
MNQAIEQLVKTKPEQYLWNYKRFKGIIRTMVSKSVKDITRCSFAPHSFVVMPPSEVVYEY